MLLLYDNAMLTLNKCERFRYFTIPFVVLPTTTMMTSFTHINLGNSSAPSRRT